MLNKKVEINDDDNFYHQMWGMVIKETPMAVLVSISFTDCIQEVYFFKDQVLEIRS